MKRLRAVRPSGRRPLPQAGSSTTRASPAGDPTNDGVTEWAGWSFADKDWWAFVAGDQNRSWFAKAKGAVAVADCDEWDDLAHTGGEYNAFLSTPEIDVSGVNTGSVRLTFDSSWRDEPTMTANITVIYDGKPAIEVLRWESVENNPNFHNDAENETVTVDLKKPAGAKKMVVTFGLTRAGNNWWWAIDNLKVTGASGAGEVTLLTEDFEGVPLGPPVDEIPPVPGNYWTHTPPAGWSNDNSAIPGVGDPNTDGVTEWAGWCFTNKDWWVKSPRTSSDPSLSQARALWPWPTQMSGTIRTTRTGPTTPSSARRRSASPGLKQARSSSFSIRAVPGGHANRQYYRSV